MIFHNITVFAVYLIKACSLGKHKSLLSKSFKTLIPNPKLMNATVCFEFGINVHFKIKIHWSI